MTPEQPPRAQVVSHRSVELVNDYSQRPHPAQLHSVTLNNGEVSLWISGVDIGDYESIVGPERAAAHRRALEHSAFRNTQRDEGHFISFIHRVTDRLFY